MREHEGAIEADLQRHYGIDYLDRWRGGLSLRRLRNLIVNLPLDAVTLAAMNGGKRPWSREDVLLDDIRRTVAASAGAKDRPHPERTEQPDLPRRHSPERQRKLRDARRRRQQRHRDIEAGLIT